MSTLLIRPACAADAEALAALVNRAYRPPVDTAGWTHETSLVAGQRLSPAQVQQLLAAPAVQIFLGTGGAGELQACVQVQCLGEIAEIGLLAVDPQLQQGGHGKAMLAAAETHAAACGASRFRLHVLVPRGELIAFYLRRGYQLTGELDAYPESAGVGLPRQTGLEVATMEKRISAA